MIELMVAITISLLVVAALTTMFVQSSRSRDELERATQQIESGRYALVSLSDDLQLAGFWSRFNIEAAIAGGLTVPGTKPDACATALGAYGPPATGLHAAITLHVQGYNNGSNPDSHCGAGFSTLTDYKAGTDVLVIRRASTCVKDAADCGEADGYVNNAPYFQASTCAPATGGTELSDPSPKEWFRLETTIANLNRRRKAPGGCANFAPMHQYLTHIYYLASNFQAGDGIPTLKRVDLGTGNAFGSPIPIAAGVENLQFEYGIDDGTGGGTAGDGAPDVFVADPDIHPRTGGPYANCGANPDCIANWRDVMAVRIYLLARSVEETPGHSDTKLYRVSTSGATVGPFNDRHKRHAYQAVVRLTNPAGRRE